MLEHHDISEIIAKKLTQWMALVIGAISIIGSIVYVANRFSSMEAQIREITFALQSYKKEQELTLQLLEANLRPVSQNLQSVVDSKLRQAESTPPGDKQ